MEPGEYVIDADDDEPDLAVVLHESETSIAEWTIDAPEGKERTVADDNPAYSNEEPVVVVAFVESGLNQEWPGWTEADPDDLYDGVQAHDVNRYHFPASRLEVLDEKQIAEFTQETTVAIDDLKTRLEDAEWQTDMDGGVLVVEKMGEQYHIHPTGDVEGEGDIREPLENIVTQYMTEQ